MSEENFTFNFYGNVGQNIAKVEKMDVHMGEDGTIQVMNAEGITMPSNQQSHSDESNKTSEPTIEQRVKTIYDSCLCRNQADWGIVFKLLVELKKIGATAYEECANLINTTCGEDVTNADAIRLSKANQSLSGSYHSGYRDTSPTVQTDSFLKRVNEIADIFMQK
ncbi:MAG: hypothetical protein SPK90_07005 [Bacteroidales bacterium]|nr:hypothetical protein [Bacteroidales bacterium]MDY6405833.1 hypothetical protein [Bacteroidales bacterium]